MTSTAPLRSDAARNRELVLEAAGELLRERGLDVTMQEIAEAAGVGVGTVCRRFRTKDDLVAALVELRMERLMAIVRGALARVEEDAWAAFVDCFEGAVDVHVRDRGFLQAIAEGGGFSHPRTLELRAQALELIGELVERAIAAGAVRADLLAEDVPELVCMVSRTGGCPGGTPVDAVSRACTIVLDGIRHRD